ncbi:MAG: hypothetical protein MRERV_8c037 [Mycoplasmataceae bacterium RV_VA103A]|nr:MAG: hypothetical protein MRERV_8c037 [Mycoplasmataceae bacterium RV_VA103A]
MSKDIKKPCKDCQKRIDRIKQEHKNKKWCEEVVNEIKRGCIETYQLMDHSAYAALDCSLSKKCLKCNEFYTFSHNFTSFRKEDDGGIRSYSIEKKEAPHYCNEKDAERERERERESFELFQTT